MGSIITIAVFATLTAFQALPQGEAYPEACEALLGPETGRLGRMEERRAACASVVGHAKRMGADPVEVVALSWGESRMAPWPVSKGGARGPLQVIPTQLRRWRDRGRPGAPAECDLACELEVAGIWTWKRWRARSRDVQHAACRYTKGYLCRRDTIAWRWGGGVADKALEIRESLELERPPRLPECQATPVSRPEASPGCLELAWEGAGGGPRSGPSGG